MDSDTKLSAADWSVLERFSFGFGTNKPLHRRKPFDLIAETAAIDAKRKAAGEVSNGLSKNWLPFVDTYRTLCLAPDPQLKRVFEEIRNFDMAA